MNIVDTNYLVRLFTRSPEHLARQAVVNLQAAQPESIFLRDYVTSELVYVLEFHTQLAYTRSQITEGLLLILSHASLLCDRPLHRAALKIYEKSKFDYVDCLVIAEHHLKRAAKVLSFDKQLLKHL